MKNIIYKIINSPIIYAKFLNTLSLLEYIGARKILKSQRQENINEKILAHATEELRHAQVLKKAAQRLTPGLCKSYLPDELICGTDATHYFQVIDQTVQQQLTNNNPIQAYLYTTFLIETRAIEFYTIFEATLAELNKPTVFRGIITEENNHLTEILNCLKRDITFANNIYILSAIEQKEFMNFMNSIDNTI